MSNDDLSSLLTQLAEEVEAMPHHEFSAPSWAKARRSRRRRWFIGGVVAVVLVATPVALVVHRQEPPVRPAQTVHTPTPQRARAAHTATLLSDGRVLLIGGCATDGCATAEVAPSTEFYVPGQGFVAGPELGQPRQLHTATLLRDGRVLVAGGWAREGTQQLASAEVYDPAAQRFSPVGSMVRPRGGQFATLLRDGQVFVVGGETGTGSGPGDGTGATAELFDPTRNTFSAAPPMPPSSVVGGAIALPDGRVLVVGGQDASGAAVVGAVYDPVARTWKPTGALQTGRSKFGLAPLPDGRVLVLGGTTDDRNLLRSTEIWDPTTGQFTPGPPMNSARYKLTDVAVLGGMGPIVVAGGGQVEVYDGDRFHPVVGTAGRTRWFPTVTALSDGDVLVVGGYDDRIRPQQDAQLISASTIAAATG